MCSRDLSLDQDTQFFPLSIMFFFIINNFLLSSTIQTTKNISSDMLSCTISEKNCNIKKRQNKTWKDNWSSRFSFFFQIHFLNTSDSQVTVKRNETTHMQFINPTERMNQKKKKIQNENVFIYPEWKYEKRIFECSFFYVEWQSQPACTIKLGMEEFELSYSINERKIHAMMRFVVFCIKIPIERPTTRRCIAKTLLDSINEIQFFC